MIGKAKKYIYKITNPIGQVYIGNTGNVDKRIKNYINHPTKITQPKLQASILKYGWDNHVLKTIDVCDSEDSNEREVFWISYFNCYYYKNNNGLNLTPGGWGAGGKRVGVFTGRRLEQRDLNGVLLKIWEGGVREVCATMGFNNQPIYAVIKKQQIQSKGFIWCYEGTFDGIRENIGRTIEARKRRSVALIEKFKSGYIHPKKGMTGNRNHRSIKIYCSELDIEFESHALAAKYLHDNYFPYKSINSINSAIFDCRDSKPIKKHPFANRFNFKVISK